MHVQYYFNIISVSTWNNVRLSIERFLLILELTREENCRLDLAFNVTYFNVSKVYLDQWPFQFWDLQIPKTVWKIISLIKILSIVVAEIGFFSP